MDNGIGYRAVHRMVVVDNRMWILTVRLPRAQDKEKTRKANNKENRTSRRWRRRGSRLIKSSFPPARHSYNVHLKNSEHWNPREPDSPLSLC